MSRRTRGLCRRTPTVTAWHGGSAERSTSSRVRIVAELATTHHAVPAPRKRTTKSRCSRERAADGPEAGQLSSEGRSAWTRRILEAAAVIRSVHTADRADVVGQQQAWSNPERVRRLSLRNIEPDTFSLVFCTPYHSCVFWTATQLFSFALPSYRTRGSLYKQTTGPAARTACTLTPHVYTTSNMLHTDHSTVVQADHVTDRTVVCRMSRIIGITCESCQTKHARLVALTCRPTTQNTLPTLHARHAAPVQ